MIKINLWTLTNTSSIIYMDVTKIAYRQEVPLVPCLDFCFMRSSNSLALKVHSCNLYDK